MTYEYTVRQKGLPAGQKPDEGFVEAKLIPGIQYQDEGRKGTPAQVQIEVGGLMAGINVPTGKTLEVKVSVK